MLGGIVLQPIENNIDHNSDYYIYTPSTQAQKFFLYPLITGYFRYQPGYSLRRTSLDSYQIMHIKRGSCKVEIGGRTFSAKENQIIFLDCYAPHAYYSAGSWEAEWLHFDGECAQAYYNMIVPNGNPVITLRNSYRFEKYLHKIYVHFKTPLPGRPPHSAKEVLFNSYIVNILTELLTKQSSMNVDSPTSGAIEDSITYIGDHLSENITLNDLAAKVSLSPFYFSRLFKKETGFSPHQYLIATRINHAKFLLQSSDVSVKSICFSVGFTSESSFCTAFKRETGITPSEFRIQIRE